MPVRRGAAGAGPGPGRVPGTGGTTEPGTRPPDTPAAPDEGRVCGIGPAEDGRASGMGGADEPEARSAPDAVDSGRA
ncbi:hypothetical protein [Streptomyces sp. MAI_2237]